MTTKPSDMFGKVKERKIVTVRGFPFQTDPGAPADPGDPAALPDPIPPTDAIPPTYAGYFEFDINISFDVDEIILLSWFTGQTVEGPLSDPFFIDASILRELNYDGILTAMVEQEHDTPRIVYNMKGTRIRGTHRFTLLDVLDNVQYDRSCTIAIVLEFVQYYR